jgi:mycofactocin precursor
MSANDPAVTAAASAEEQTETTAVLVDSDSLVEEVSIDGMCGVY